MPALQEQMAAAEDSRATPEALLGLSAAYHRAAGKLAGFPFTLITSWDLMYAGTLGERRRGLVQTLWGWYISRIRELSDSDAEAWQALEVSARLGRLGILSLAHSCLCCLILLTALCGNG